MSRHKIKLFSQENPEMAIKPDFPRFKDMELRYHIVDAFTDQPFGGTAAVVAEGKLLTE